MTERPKVTKTKLLELAERVEKASGSDPCLDEAIMDALFEPQPFVRLADAPEETGFKAWRVNGQTQSGYRFTASLDAAMTLIPELNGQTAYPQIQRVAVDKWQAHLGYANNVNFWGDFSPEEYSTFMRMAHASTLLEREAADEAMSFRGFQRLPL